MLKHAVTLRMFVLGEVLLVLGSIGIMTLIGAATVAGALAIEITAWRRFAGAQASKPSPR